MSRLSPVPATMCACATKRSRKRLWLRKSRTVIGVLLGLVGRGVLAGFGFWLLHPLWLIGFWSVLGFYPNLQDIRRWYALGAFNLMPMASALITGLAIALLGFFLRRYGGKHAVRMGWWGALLGLLLIPPIAYGLLLGYAGVWGYRDWSLMVPTLARAYLFLGGTSAAVGWLVGYTLVPKQVQVIQRKEVY